MEEGGNPLLTLELGRGGCTGTSSEHGEQGFAECNGSERKERPSLDASKLGVAAVFSRLETSDKYILGTGKT